jgi:hypothetical protein
MSERSLDVTKSSILRHAESKPPMIQVPEQAPPKDDGAWRSRRILVLSLLVSVAFLAIFALLAVATLPFPRQTGPSVSFTESRALANHNTASRKGRILYVVTTLNEYNSGTRNTEKGSDRLQETLIPIVSEGVRSMMASGFQVDLYLICHYTMRPEREALVRAALPPTVGLQVWSDATPLGYDTAKDKDQKLQNRTLHLARQHRFVIKDKIAQYDMFVNFEDDMHITGEHVEHFIRVTSEIDRLYQEAPDELPPNIKSRQDATDNYHGVMTKQQLRRMIPGFIRVEVLLDEENYPAQSSTGPVPVDLDFDGRKGEVDPKICCHVPKETSTKNIPESPSSDKLMLWETNIFPLGIRQMPKGSFLDWVALQRGPAQNNLNLNATIGDYWSNRHNDYYPKQRRPVPMEFKYINNQGGWMATRDQLWRWHTEICPGGFLPPYEAPHYRFDGLDMRNVEWYSGGMQLSTVRHACNMQRIIMLDPDGFSRSLIYHTANNKQRQLHGKREKIFSKVNTLLGQLNTIKKRAQADLKNSR